MLSPIIARRTGVRKRPIRTYFAIYIGGGNPPTAMILSFIRVGSDTVMAAPRQ